MDPANANCAGSDMVQCENYYYSYNPATDSSNEYNLEVVIDHHWQWAEAGADPCVTKAACPHYSRGEHSNAKSKQAGHKLLNFLGWIPVVGSAFNGLNSFLYAGEGDWKNAALSAAAAIPFERLAAVGVKGGEEAFGSDRANASCGPNSFTGTTPVLMADGSTKPIAQVHVGDMIANARPGALMGEEDQKHVVTAVHVTYTDRDFTDVTVSTSHGPATIAGTAHHLYWDATTRSWTPADKLHVGDHLQSTDGGLVNIVVLHNFTTTDVTYNLTIDSLHTYYVVAEHTPVLVHNGGPGCGELWIDPNKIPHHYMRTSDQGGMHAEDFGVRGPYNKANSAAFVKAVERFVKNPGTEVIEGTFRGAPAIHYVDPATGLHASFAASGPNVGEYLGGWISSGDQLTYLLGQGKL